MPNTVLGSGSETGHTGQGCIQGVSVISAFLDEDNELFMVIIQYE